MELNVTGLEKRYGKRPALKNIDISLRSGEITGLLGANGAGKTTLLKYLGGYYLPPGDEILLGDHSLSGDPAGYRRYSSLLPETAPLPVRHTARQLLNERLSLFNKNDKEKKCSAMVDLFGLANEADRPVGRLSRGFRQRIGLALAVCTEPALLLLDEPFGGLDPAQVKSLRDYLAGSKGNRITLFSSHILQEVYAISDRILIMVDGEIKKDLSKADLDSWETLDSLYSHLSQGEVNE